MFKWIKELLTGPAPKVEAEVKKVESTVDLEIKQTMNDIQELAVKIEEKIEEKLVPKTKKTAKKPAAPAKTSTATKSKKPVAKKKPRSPV